MAIAYYQPVTRDQVGWILGHRVDGRQIDRDLIGRLRRLGLIANGPRSPEAGAPILYVTTPAFLKQFGLESLDQLPEREKLEAAGLLDKAKLLAQRRDQIGRATCRERVGEYVQITGGGVALKKKPTTP